MRFPPKIIACLLILPTLIGCYATRYDVYREEGPEVRMTGMKEGETFVRSVRVKSREHYFLLGAVTDVPVRDIAREAGLGKDEILTNLTIENSLDEVDTGLLWAGIVLTAGIVPMIWTTRTTTITGRVVRRADKNTGEDLAPAPEPGEEDPAEETKAVTPKEKSREWIPLQQALTYDAAISGCKDAGGRLPSRKELAEGRENSVTPSVGDVWTSDGSGDEVYTFDTNTGATFFRSPAEALPVLCLGE